MLDGRKAVDDRPADALGGRIGRDEIGILRLEAFELVHERVELGIGDLGGGPPVVAVLVIPDLPAELRDSLNWIHSA
jgi:hypothetical protein